MKRRQLIAAGAASALPLHARAQQPAKRYRIAYLTGGSEVASQPLLVAFATALGTRCHTMKAAWATNLEARPERDWERLVGRAVSLPV